MKKMTTVICLILWFVSGNVCAENATTAPYSAKHCDKNFENQTLPLSPDRNSFNRVELLPLPVSKTVTKAGADANLLDYLRKLIDAPDNNKLHCFPVLKVITASIKPDLGHSMSADFSSRQIPSVKAHV